MYYVLSIRGSKKRVQNIPPVFVNRLLIKVCSADKVFTVYTFVVLLIKFCATINESGVFLNLNRFS
jgi:hypothetical protein